MGCRRLVLKTINCTVASNIGSACSCVFEAHFFSGSLNIKVALLRTVELVSLIQV
jgi:hypothetical protein